MLSIAYLQVEVKENDHLPLAWLEECIFDVVVEDVHLVTTHAGVSEEQNWSALENVLCLIMITIKWCKV